MGKISANHISDNGLTLRLYEELLQPDNKKDKQSALKSKLKKKKQAKGFNRHFYREDILISN